MTPFRWPTTQCTNVVRQILLGVSAVTLLL